MAIIKCPECSNEISNKAYKCTKCGIQIRRPKRSFFGRIIKYFFILFNLLMAFWLFVGVGSSVNEVTKQSTDTGVVGAAIGTGIGAMMIITIWFLGTVIIGIFVFLTRPKS